MDARKLIEEIVENLTDEHAGLSNTLRKAKILAKHLGVVEFQDWIRFELDGYRNPAPLPSYRKHPAANHGTFMGSYGRQMTGVMIPTLNLPAGLKEFAESFSFAQGIGELESAIDSNSGSLQRRWPSEYVTMAREYVKMSGDMVLVDVSQPIPIHLLAAVVDSVKNRLVDFLLDLEKLDLSGGGVPSKAPDARQVRNLFNINIYGDHNVVASGERVRQVAVGVAAGDVESAVKQLVALGADGNDVAEFREVVRTEQALGQGRLGPKVSSWFGKMATKAASGLLKIGMEVAPKAIMEILKAYYGWP